MFQADAHRGAAAPHRCDSPTLPAGWESWVFWQHSEGGSVAGIDGSVDLDTFNGGLEQLARYPVPGPR